MQRRKLKDNRSGTYSLDYSSRGWELSKAYIERRDGAIKCHLICPLFSDMEGGAN
jgi:hypothetical protein